MTVFAKRNRLAAVDLVRLAPMRIHIHAPAIAEGGSGGFSHPCRVIVSKDAEPPDLTSRNSSVTGSLSTPITEQKQQRSHRETGTTHGLLHPNTHRHVHIHGPMYCIFM